VPKLVALDLELSPSMYVSLTRLVESRTAFCVLDQRISPELKKKQTQLLGATHVLTAEGEINLHQGTEVDKEIGLVMLTSGSSGEPKVAELSWDALMASARITSQALSLDVPSVWVPALPANHIGGLAVLLRSALGFADLFWTSDISSAPDKGATHISVVQAQAVRTDLSGYQRVLLGGAKPPAQMAPNMIATWGMTETGSGIVYDGLALPEVEVVALDGELLVRSPTLFTQYRGSPRPEILGPDGRSDWFPTGDGGRVIDGVVEVFGRLGSVITTGGEKVWPEQLELALQAFPGISQIGLCGIEDEKWGQAIVAIVVTTHPILLEELADYAESQAGPWAKPKHLVVVDGLPRTSNGKLRRAALAEIARAALSE
jgi:o-succinylbenzoate---CoA ligase